MMFSSDFDVVEAGDGAEGEEVREEWPDLVISDLMMPKRDGIAFLSTDEERHTYIAYSFHFVDGQNVG